MKKIALSLVAMLFATLSMAQEHRNTLNTAKSKKKECVTVAQASAPNA